MKWLAEFRPIFLSFALTISIRMVAQQQGAGPATVPRPTEQGNPSAEEQHDFEGTIIKTKIGATFLLMDYQHRTAYILDDRDTERMKRLDGKKVVVTGTLDPLSNTIMLSAIRVPG